MPLVVSRHDGFVAMAYVNVVGVVLRTVAGPIYALSLGPALPVETWTTSLTEKPCGAVVVTITVALFAVAPLPVPMQLLAPRTRLLSVRVKAP
jgi:hypothetical protein